MNNRLSLYEYLSSFKTVSEKRQVFYAIFEEMHRYHNNGEYIPNLSFQTISVCFTNPTDIHFAYYEKIGNRPIQEVLNLKFQNILLVSQMMVCSFMEFDYSMPLVCISVLEQQLTDLKSHLHPVDYVYFEKVFIQKEYLYYDDYIRNLGKDTFLSLKEKRGATESEQAFTCYLLLTINLIVVGMIFACMFLYLR